VEGPQLVWGEAARPTLARSGLKPIQALPLIRTGAADRFGLSDDEVVLACASHNAEPDHVATVGSWLERIGLGPDALECGPALPGRDDDLARHLQAGRGPEPIFNNCSGKHAGFLTVARHLEVDHRGYLEPDHPVQQLVSEAVAAFCRTDLAQQVPGRDGCGIPTWSVPLAELAAGMARLVTPGSVDPAWDSATARVSAAAPSRAWWISGTGRHEVDLAGLASEPILSKAGAEGVFMAALPDRGLGIAVKAADGAARAAQVALSAALAHLGVVPAEAVPKQVTNVAGRVVGSVAPVGDAPATVG
ncbi:MAG: asparaginase, partial [Actinomycetota bacterium]